MGIWLFLAMPIASHAVMSGERQVITDMKLSSL